MVVEYSAFALALALFCVFFESNILSECTNDRKTGNYTFDADVYVPALHG